MWTHIGGFSVSVDEHLLYDPIGKQVVDEVISSDVQDEEGGVETESLEQGFSARICQTALLYVYR